MLLKVKSASYHDITDFVVGNSEEEIIVGGNGTQQVILKSGPRKPKLEAVTLAQWTVANLGILYKLLGKGKLDSKSILDYLSYTAKVCQLVQRFNLVSVFMYDREYRRLQSTHGFRWGIDTLICSLYICKPVYPEPTLPPPKTLKDPFKSKQGNIFATSLDT